MDLQSLDDVHRPGPWGYNHGTPYLVADGRAYRIADLPSRIRAKGICVSRANDKTLPTICERIRADAIFFRMLRASDLTPISTLPGLRALGIFANPKPVDYRVLGHLKTLRVLALRDNRNEMDLAFLEGLAGLRSLCISGGFSKPTRIATLAPIAKLKNLKELRLYALRVEADGLLPLENCRSLRKFEVSNNYPTEQFAYLSVRLPRAKCPMFSASVRMSGGDDKFDTMIVGSRKPFLHSTRDAERIREYEAAFAKLQARYRV